MPECDVSKCDALVKEIESAFRKRSLDWKSPLGQLVHKQLRWLVEDWHTDWADTDEVLAAKAALDQYRELVTSTH